MGQDTGWHELIHGRSREGQVDGSRVRGGLDLPRPVQAIDIRSLYNYENY